MLLPLALESGKRSASANGTQRKRPGGSPGPIATRLASMVWMCSRSSTQLAYAGPRAAISLARAACTAASVAESAPVAATPNRSRQARGHASLAGDQRTARGKGDMASAGSASYSLSAARPGSGVRTGCAWLSIAGMRSIAAISALSTGVCARAGPAARSAAAARLRVRLTGRVRGACKAGRRKVPRSPRVGGRCRVPWLQRAE